MMRTNDKTRKLERELEQDRTAQRETGRKCREDKKFRAWEARNTDARKDGFPFRGIVWRTQAPQNEK